MNKKIVIFDLLGVITKEPMFATNIIYPMVKGKISYDLFKKKYLLYATGSISRNDFWEFICLRKDIEKFEKRIIKKTLLTPGIKKVMTDLAASGCELYLASEIPQRWGDLLLEKGGIKKIFKKKFYSSDLLTTKPFFSFYKKVFNNINNGEIYYIDDTLINLVAAQKIKSLNTVFFASKNKFSFRKEINFNIDNLKKLNEVCKIKE